MDKNTVKKKCHRALAVVAGIESLSAERKKLYDEHDLLVTELRDVPGLEANGIVLERTFGKGNTQWGHGPVRELVIKAVDQVAAAPKVAGKKKTTA